MDRGGQERHQQGMSRPQPRPDQPRAEVNNDLFDPSAAQMGTFSGEQGYPYHRQRVNPARQEAQETPAQPADERMSQAAANSADLYRAWKAAPGEQNHQALADSLHEIRKILARMEIEMSASRKDEQRPIPAPAYRNQQRTPQQPRE
jgi:hypothetical protein